MDESVIQSMAKWPNVPDCYGWLHLNAQGQWLMGEVSDDSRPSVVAHAGLQGFMNRNYVCPFPASANPDHPHAGAWALQNGPQRVWVTLALAPLVVQWHEGVFTAHTGSVMTVTRLIQSSDGVVYCNSPQGAGAISSRSVEAFSENVLVQGEQLIWSGSKQHAPLHIEPCEAHLIETKLGFQRQITR